MKNNTFEKSILIIILSPTKKRKPKMNICGSEDIIDPFYRYKMDKLIVTRQKNATCITNIKKVSKDIERNELMIIEHFKYKFNAPFTFKNDIVKTSKIIEYEDFEFALREFIEHFVLCKNCGLPETEYLNEGKNIYINCRACSASFKMDPHSYPTHISKTCLFIKKITKN